MVSEMQLLDEDQLESIFGELYWLYPNNPTLQSIGERSKSEIVEALLSLSDVILIDVIQQIFRKRPSVWKQM